MPEVPGLISGFIVNPPVLWLILFCVDRQNADRSWFKLVLATWGICVATGILTLCILPSAAGAVGVNLVPLGIPGVAGMGVLSWCVPPYAAPFVGALIALIVSVLVLRRFCDVRWFRTIISAILFTAWLVVWPVLGMYLLTELAS
jgi:hypothetical protein